MLHVVLFVCIVPSQPDDLAEVRANLSTMYEETVVPKPHPPPEMLEMATMYHRNQLMLFNEWKQEAEDEGVKDTP